MKLRIIVWKTVGYSVFESEGREIDITVTGETVGWSKPKLDRAVREAATECRNHRDKWLAKQKLAEADRRKAGR